MQAIKGGREGNRLTVPPNNYMAVDCIYSTIGLDVFYGNQTTEFRGLEPGNHYLDAEVISTPSGLGLLTSSVEFSLHSG